MQTIEELKEDMGYCLRNYEDAKRRYEDALIKAYPFREGDIIRSSKGALAQVARIYVQYGVIHVRANLQKKDGTFGNSMTHLWRPEWDNPELVKE